jgi:hypothetical protein
LVTSLFNIRDFVAEMVDAAVRIALQEGGDGRACTEDAEELDLGVRKVDKNRANPMFRLLFFRRYGGAQGVTSR